MNCFRILFIYSQYGVKNAFRTFQRSDHPQQVLKKKGPKTSHKLLNNKD